ncbi:MAG: hypothetical protein AAGH41_14780 [Pseudomonadota bacterium]
MIETLALLVTLRELQSLLTPKSLDLLVVDAPAFSVKQLADLAVAISPVLLGEPDQCQT